MIHDLGVALQANLRARGCPFVVVAGPEERAHAGTFARERVVLQRDADTYRAGRGTKGNPARGAWFREVGCIARIVARSPRSGALASEHYERAEHVLDFVTIGLDEVVRGTLKSMLTISGGGFVELDDVAPSERIAGAIYELRFSVERGVYAETWTGEARPEAVVGEFGITTGTRRVSVDGSEVETF